MSCKAWIGCLGQGKARMGKDKARMSCKSWILSDKKTSATLPCIVILKLGPVVWNSSQIFKPQIFVTPPCACRMSLFLAVLSFFGKVIRSSLRISMLVSVQCNWLNYLGSKGFGTLGYM